MADPAETSILDDDPRGMHPGTRIGPWELLKPLETGGMGVVWLGRRADDVYEQTVAIKLIRPGHLVGDGTLGKQLVARFEAERQILARMNHPNVARILDGGTTADGQPFLVMEFVDGVSLTDHAKRENLDVPARLALFAKVCDGVQEAHRHLVVHRDLKPDNILVGVDGEPRLLDFGIAKPLQAGVADAGRGDTGISAMTPAYASPEQVRQEPLGTGSDIYSLGVVLYQLLAGVRPYELGGLRPAEAEHVVCDLRPEPLRKMLERAALDEAERKRRRAQLTPDVERIVEKAMHKDAARRYGSAQALAEDLRRYLAGEPVQATPDSPAYRLRKFVGRHRAGTAIAAIALAAVLTATGVALVQARRAQQAATDTATVNKFLVDVLRASDPYTTGGELTLAEAVDAAAASIDTRFAGRPDLSVGVRHALGYSQIGRARLESADALLQRAHADALAAFGADDSRTLEIVEALAQLRLEQGRVDEAGVLWNGVVSALEAQGRQGEALYRTAINNLGLMHLALEDYAGARPWFERALAIPFEDASGPRAREERATMHANLAQVAHGLGEYDGADAEYREAEDALRVLYPDGHPDLAIVLNNRALLAADRDDLEGSYALLQQSLAMREKSLGGADHPLIVTALVGLAQTALRLDRTEEGLAMAARAEAMALRVYPAPHRTRVFAHIVHAGALINSRRFVEAGEAVTRAEETLAALEEKPDDLVATVPGIRHALCMRPRDPPVPSCAGIEPTEPPLE